MLDSEKTRKLWLVSALVTVFALCVIAFTPLGAEDKAETRRVREAIYGDRPLGLPWLAVHAAVCTLIVIPLPLCVVSTCQLLGAGAGLGIRSWHLFSLLFRSYREVSKIPELRALYVRVTLTWG